MRPDAKAWIAGTVTAALWLGCLGWWLTRPPVSDLELATPYRDGRPHEEGDDGNLATGPAVVIGEFFERGADVEVPETAGEWPRFRGRGFDNINREPCDLLDAFPPGGPRTLWRIDVGEGHAGAAVSRGRVYLLDYDETRSGDALRCLSLADGTELWRRWYRVQIKRNHGMSRSVPSVADGVVVTIGPKAHVMAVDALSGARLWTLDMVRRYGSTIPGWYTAQCPLVDGGRAILAPAGPDVLLTAVDLRSGEVQWESRNPAGFDMSHSSVMPMDLSGRRTYVYAGVGGLAGVAADTGEVLWVNTDWHPAVVAPSPIILPDDHIFATAGYGGGSVLLRIRAEGGAFLSETLRIIGPDEGLASEQQTPLFYDGALFGILPKDAGTARKQLVCYNAQAIDQPVWKSGKTRRFGLGPYLAADGKLIVLDDDGTLILLRLTRNGYEELDRAKIFDAQDAWGPLALADGHLVLRDATRMLCVDLRKGTSGDE